MERIIECVPNFSEGRDTDKVEAIAAAIASSDGVRIMHVDRGEAANRTVITFAGSPEAVVEGAFRGAARAAELIDMRRHHGEHPRIGATDVLPLVPVSGVTLEECAMWARELGERMFRELGIPVFLYDAAALKESHFRLEDCRRGEWEGLRSRIADDSLCPDFCDRMNPGELTAGASVVGARKFLIAVNFNLRPEDTLQQACRTAAEIRQSGHVLRTDGWDGEPVKDGNGNPIRVPGILRGVKAIGWRIEEYGRCQVSVNITDMELEPLHRVWETVCERAEANGASVTGTEIIGLVPLKALTDAADHFMGEQARVMTTAQRISVAVERMGLDDLCPFDAGRKVIEMML